MQAAAIGLSFWWGYWATHQDTYSTQDFLLITSAIVSVAVVCGLIRSILFAQGGLDACRTLYSRLSTAVFHTHISFFETTPLGRITNRFVRDCNTIDDGLPFILNILLAQAFLMLGIIVVVVVVVVITIVFIVIHTLLITMHTFY
jgi:ABC-type multidrug transport system fused ATPase/permease subunit